MKSSRYAISQIILIAVVVIIIVLASAGVFFLVGGKESTNSSTTSSMSSSILTTTSSSTTISSTTSSMSSSILTTTSSSTSTISSQKYNLPYVKSSNTIAITLTILNNASYAVNFNNTNFGAMAIFIPANVNLNLTLLNEQSLPHNLVLVQNNTDVANNGDVGKDGKILLAIATTTTNYLTVGKSTGSYSGNYSSISAGTYWLACGTLGHAVAGLWVDMFASSSVSTPYVVITNPQLRPSGFT